MVLLFGGTTTPDRLPASPSGIETGLDVNEEFEVASFRVRIERSFDLPGTALGLTFRGDDDGYIALGRGEILHFTLGRELAFRSVVDGLSQPRGVAFHDGRLYVTDISIPCGRLGDLVRCSERDFPGTWPGPAQAQILRESRGRVLAYDVEADGGLTNERVIVDELPVATSDHAVNGIVAGPDGRLYMAIGNVDSLRSRPEVVREMRRPNIDLLGTIVRFRPDGSDLEVFARGIRNVYGIVFDDDGKLYGVDNDGPTKSGYRAEEVIRFERGENYGYPEEGTYGPFNVRTAGPLWTLRTNGSSGIEWAPRVGLEPGLIVGSCFHLMYVRLREDSGRPFWRNDEQELDDPRGCLPVVTAAPDGRLVIATINPSRLYVYRLRQTD